MINSYNVHEDNKVPIILNCLISEGLQFIQTPNNDKQDMCKTRLGLFEVLSKKFEPPAQQNYSITLIL